VAIVYMIARFSWFVRAVRAFFLDPVYASS
jgi:hypothetical protein